MPTVFEYFPVIPIRLFFVTPNAGLVRMIRVIDRKRRFETTRFRSLSNACEKARFHPDILLLAQWTAGEIPEKIAEWSRLGTGDLAARFFVYVSDLPKRSVSEAEEIRFSLLQTGVTAVFSSLRELSSTFAALPKHVVSSSAISDNESIRDPEDLRQLFLDRLAWKS